MVQLQQQRQQSGAGVEGMLSEYPRTDDGKSRQGVEGAPLWWHVL